MSQQNSATINKSTSWQMFDQIAVKYDFLNHILSFGADIIWRKQLVNFLPQNVPLTILDLATGTGDVLIACVKHHSQIITAIGIDMADKMLAIGQKKIQGLKLDGIISLQHGDANKTPFPDKHFKVVTMAFGIRNIENPITCLKEMYRVLDNKGCALILEFSLPDNLFIRSIHLFYLRKIIPIIGGLLSGNFQAYRYLNRTIEKFPYGETFCRLMRQVGFEKIKANPLLFGIATLYKAEKY